jgi:hypothetical protein
LKKILIIIIILILSSAGYYFFIGEDIIGLKNNELEVADLETLDINKSDHQVLTDKGIVSYNTHTLNFYSYKNEKWNLEIPQIIDNIYVYDNIYVLSNNRNTLSKIDFSGNLIDSLDFEESILSIEEDGLTLLVGKDIDENNAVIKINNNGEVSKSIIDGNIVILSPKEEVDSYFMSYFKFIDGNITTIIQQRLVTDDIKIWENKLVGEIALDFFKTSTRTFVLTDKNFYAFNSDGIILWKYSNFGIIKDVEIDIENKKILLLEDSRMHTLQFDSTVLTIQDFDKKYNEVKLYSGGILLSNNIEIDYLDGNVNNIWKNDEILLDYYINNEDIYIITDFNIYKGKIKTGR